MDGTPTLIFADELADFSWPNLDMSGFWAQRILADLGEDCFAEGSRLAKQRGVEVKVLVIGGAILDP